jgi:hypothetical protein
MLTRAVALLLATACALAGVAHAQPAASEYERLGHLERQEVDAVLAERELAVDPAPAGKVIGRVHVVTRPVFSARDGFLTILNVFHVTTRERAIERELLFAEGEPWDQAVIDETLRGIRDPFFHNVIVILPIASDEPGRVEVLVVVRDVWSLRLQSRWEVQGLDIISLALSLSENNLLGFRKRAALAFSMDQGVVLLGPSYLDPNVVGTRLTFRTAFRLAFARHGGELEGTRSETAMSYPLWSLRQRWGGSLTVAHVVGPERRFVGLGLRTYDAPETEAVEALPWVYQRREVGSEAQVVRAFGLAVRQKVALGHELGIARPALSPGFPDEEVLRAAFTRDVLPRSERVSALFASWELYTPVYGAYRDLDTFDFREDFQLGPLVTARAAAARTELGSERDFFRLSAGARWSAGWAGGLWRAAGSLAVRVEEGRLVDRTHALSALAVTPSLGGWVRVIAAAHLEWLEAEEGNRFYALGGTNGLRGYAVNQFAGRARAIGHLELRSRPLRAGFFRLGGVAFWDLGHAAATPGALRLHHSLGVGARALIPQLDPLVFRFDWAVPLGGPDRGLPGRLILGVEQAF